MDLLDKGEKEALTEIFRLEHELEKLKAPELTKWKEQYQ